MFSEKFFIEALWNISTMLYKTENANSGMPVLPILVAEASTQN